MKDDTMVATQKDKVTYGWPAAKAKGDPKRGKALKRGPHHAGTLCHEILPHMPMESSPHRGFSRRCQQRVRKRIARQRAVNRAVDALNWLQTGQEVPTPFAGDCPLHDTLLRHVVGFSVPPISSQLLRGRTGYEIDVAPPSVAPYVVGKVSPLDEPVGMRVCTSCSLRRALLDGLEEPMLTPREETWQE
eukprot:1486272-Amphidinium_carterae.1